MKARRRNPLSKQALVRLFAAGAALAVTATSSAAKADDSPYCRKVRAHAAGDAALLVAPTLQAQGVRFPNNGVADAGVTTGTGYQVRAALSWSPLDFYKGFRVIRMGDADCERQEAVVTAQQVLLYGEDYGRLPAYRKQGEFLAARRGAWNAIVAKNDERLEARVTSLLDANEVRGRAAELDLKVAQVGGNIGRLEARGVDDYRGMLSSLMSAVEDTSMRYEREASHLRSLDAWQLSVTGGVTPLYKPLDYYGVVQIGFNLGAFSRNGSETRYLDARAEELRKARYELREQLRRFRQQVRVTSAQAAREVQIVDSKVASLAGARQSLEHSEATNAPHAMAVIDLELMSAESERVFLTALVSELSRLEENGHGE